jgi:hypothetical protein
MSLHPHHGDVLMYSDIRIVRMSEDVGVNDKRRGQGKEGRFDEDTDDINQSRAHAAWRCPTKPPRGSVKTVRPHQRLCDTRIPISRRDTERLSQQ